MTVNVSVHAMAASSDVEPNPVKVNTSKSSLSEQTSGRSKINKVALVLKLYKYHHLR